MFIVTLQFLFSMKKTVFNFGSYIFATALAALCFTNCSEENGVTPDAVTENVAEKTDGHGHLGGRCSMHEHQTKHLLEHPEAAEKKRKIEEFTAKFVSEYGKTAKARTVVTIPVVIHVLYKTAVQNISDAQIASQMKVLNDDFRKLNTDVSKVPTPFKPLASDIEINFVLAKQTPTGAPTTGIVRKSTSKTSFIDNLDPYSDALGGSNIWDASRYMNIYVCNMASPLGFAADPSFPDSEDAIVVHYTAFGTTGVVEAPYNLGRTATHEVGHWLNLAHIWGPGDPDVANCNDSDNVGDTPNQAKSNGGTPTFPKVSCGNTPNGDMFMNYMDYVDDAAMFMFTTGQKARMQALFASGGARATIATSNGATPPSSGTSCGVPSTLTTSNVTTSAATLNWAAVSGATSYSVQYKTAAATTFTTVVSNSNTLTINSLAANTAYQFQVKATCSNGTSAFSTIANFTTQAVVNTGCTDNYESNNTSSTSKVIPINTEITAKIGTATDKDWFTFTTTAAQPKFKIDLTNLPLDYDIELYKNGSFIAYSQNDGTLAELITQNATTAGTYKIKVYTYYGDFSNSNCYTLKVQTGSTNFKAGKMESNNKKVKNLTVNSL